MNFDYIVIGAGIVGLSTAWKLSLKYPDACIAVLEKEDRVAAHQTGRNSGVIHSGIYYQPGSRKAKNCLNGRHQLVEFCRKYGVEHDVCGKVIVGTKDEEISRLKKIYERGLKNGIEGIRLISRNELHEIEPYVSGVQAIHVPCAGIVDFAGVCKKLQQLLEQGGNRIIFDSKVTGIFGNNGTVTVSTDREIYTTSFLINCGGLYCDHLAESAGVSSPIKIVPFRGEYFELAEEAQKKVNGLIYPLPNPEFPFLGVHFTRMAGGGVECGPNAVFAFKREGYSKFSFNFKETIETVDFPGFWKLAGKHWKMGLDEMYRSFSKKAFLKNLQELIPSIEADDLIPSPSGVRAMALKPDGEILDDFHFETRHRQVHVLNAPSPAATAGLAIGDEIVEQVSA